MDTQSARASEEAHIRTLIDAWVDAMRAKDVERIMAHHVPDFVAFDCHSQLRIRGAEAYRTFLEACFPCMQSMTFDIDALDITAQDGVAFAHYLARCVATGLDGTEHASRLRATVCLRKTNGTWQIAHAHVSAPFDPMSGKAMLDLPL